MNQIITDKCDNCGLSNTPVVLYHHRGTPVLTSCRVCGPLGFEHVARLDIDAWLRGEPDAERAFGR